MAMAGDSRQQVRDEMVVVRCQLGERLALDELVERWHPRLWCYVQSMIGQSGRHDESEEAAQEAWIRVLRGLPRLREPARFAPWLFGIARRMLMDRLRDKYAAALQATDLADVAADAPEPASDAADAEEVTRLRDGMDRLPLIERETLTLFYLEGLSLREVAEVADVPEGTVKSRLWRGRRMLRELMVQRQIEQQGARS
jgi:RNA polymerase sigma factor (sigma-70 family)